MISFQYRFKDISGTYRTYQLSQESPESLWCIHEENLLLARFSQIQQSWKQLSGDALPKEFIRGAGAHIQRYYYESAALKIQDRWPGIISRTEKRSDSEVFIICKPQVNLNVFRPIFCKHVSRLFNQDILLNLEVSTYNGSEKFSFKLNPPQSTKQPVA
ncbi:hypothetical protein QWY86_06205 [Pedobacter aquatilis]|uniref:hypothetical protein n=1 Tax=Pedobacter aquatilis TaxID=351343 RepID=UPI0025B330C2|nr:hypothetical protein [Pedobacter aquatilis]MDN3586251.1 hypothetical protein [Pedobacter aquatilis]